MPRLTIEFLKISGGAAILERQKKSGIIDARAFEPPTNPV